MRTLSGHKGSVWDVKHVGDNRIVSCSGDKTVRLWNYERGGHLQKFNSLHRELLIIENKYICGLCLDYDDKEGPGMYLKLHKKDDLEIFQNIYFEKLLVINKEEYFQGIVIEYMSNQRFAICFNEYIAILDFNGNRR